MRVCVRVVHAVDLGDGPGDSPEHTRGILNGMAVLILEEVAVLQDSQGVLRQVQLLRLAREPRRGQRCGYSTANGAAVPQRLFG